MAKLGRMNIGGVRFLAFVGVLIGVVALMPATAATQKKTIQFKWKFRAGDAFDLDETIVGKTTLTVEGNKSTEEQTQHRVSRFRVTNATASSFTLEQRITTWRSTVTGGLGADQDDTKLMEQLVKDLAFTINLSPSGNITRFEGYDKFVQRLEKLDAAEAKRFKAALGEEALRAPLDQVFHILPASAVSQGQPWDYKHVVPLGPLGTFTMATEFTYRGRNDTFEEIGAKSVLSFEPKKGGGGELGFQVLKLDLTQKNGSGRVIFDNAAGRLVQMDMKLKIAGTMQLDLADTRVDVQLDGTETRTVKLTEPGGKTQ